MIAPTAPVAPSPPSWPAGKTAVPREQRMRSAKVPGPLAMVIFGATGDLTRRKLFPALFRLFSQGLLPRGFGLVGFARHALTDEAFRESMRAALEEFSEAPDPEEWERFAEAVSYVQGSFDDPAGFLRLAEELRRVDRERGTGGNRLFYMATPPEVVCGAAEQLGRAGLVRTPDEREWTRIIVEKPFGRDLESARALNARLLRAFDESQVYRIDHYLGKETVQNLLVFRFANVIWEPLWSRTYIDHVQVTMAESVGVGSRAGYYDDAGALRDMVQNHVVQLLTLVAMEPPASYDADSIRNEKVKVLRSVRPIEGDGVATETVRGRYDAGVVDGESVPGYLQEAGIAPDSRTETFTALRVWIDNWRWAGVPFYLRTGKRLPHKATEITVRFRPAPHPVLDTVQGDLPQPGQLVLRIQPREGISLYFEAKVPGLAGPLHPVSMDFSYETSFTGASPEAYERLLLDAMLGDATLFARRDEVEAAWGLITPILEGWAASDVPPLEPYPAGTWGPPGAERLVRADGREWRDP